MDLRNLLVGFAEIVGFRFAREMQSDRVLSGSNIDDLRRSRKQVLVAEKVGQTQSRRHDDQSKRLRRISSSQIVRSRVAHLDVSLFLPPHLFSQPYNPTENTKQDIRVDGTFVCLINTQHAVLAEQKVRSHLSEENTIGHELDFGR